MLSLPDHMLSQNTVLCMASILMAYTLESFRISHARYFFNLLFAASA